jgi:TolB-like protein
MSNFFAELKRRHIYQVAAAYVVVAWILLQLFNNLEPILKLPEWAGTLVLVFLAGGFPISLIFAWTLELRAAPVSADGSSLRVKSAAATEPRRAGVGFAHPTSIPKTAVISIAVLPFTNLSSDPEQEFFSDGVTEEITSALAKVPNLQVVGRTSAFEFKGQNKDLRTIGQALGATHLIEGSVRKAGMRVRITAQLIRVENGLHLWTENYDRELTDIFATQEDIAQAIAGALKVPLGLQQGEFLVSNRTLNLESYEQYLRARAQFRARAVDDAIRTLEPVVACDPSFAPAWAMLSRAYALTPFYRPQLRCGLIEEARAVARSFLDKAEMAARKAVRLDSRSAETHGAMAFIHVLGGQWAAGEDFHRKALGLDPNNTEVLEGYSVNLAAAGRVRDALVVGEKMRRLDPFVPMANLIVAEFMQAGGQSKASIPIIEPVAGDAVGGFNRNLYLAQALAATGRYADAADALLAIRGENVVSQRSVQDAARLLRLAPNVDATQTLPA